MPQIELVLPRMGESIEEATILNWVKGIGDTVEADEIILEIATDKVDSEVPSPYSGIIKQLLFEEGQVVKIGHPIAIIESDEAPEGLIELSIDDELDVINSNVKDGIPAPAGIEIKAGASASDFSDAERFYSPLVRNIAAQEGISIKELDTIKGTGKDSRVTKTDVLTYLSSKRYGVKSKPAKKSKKINLDYYDKPKLLVNSDDEIIEMDRMRRLIADHMVKSKRTSPHVSSIVEADVTNIVEWRQKVKQDFQNKYNAKLTFTPIFFEAIAKAIEDFPLINVQVDEDNIILKKKINIGMATALPSGNLIVPVIKETNTKDIVQLSREVNDLATRARENKLKPQEVQEGTFTVSNIGTFDNIMGVPIINQPQVAILALGAIKKKPAVLETPQGDVIGIRHQMYISMSYDHRVVDGILGGSFLKRVADYLESFDINRKI